MELARAWNSASAASLVILPASTSFIRPRAMVRVTSTMARICSTLAFIISCWIRYPASVPAMQRPIIATPTTTASLGAILMLFSFTGAVSGRNDARRQDQWDPALRNVNPILLASGYGRSSNRRPERVLATTVEVAHPNLSCTDLGEEAIDGLAQQSGLSVELTRIRQHLRGRRAGRFRRLGHAADVHADLV